MRYIPFTFLILLACGQSKQRTITTDEKLTDFDKFVKTFDKYGSTIPVESLVHFLQVDTIDMEHRTYWTIKKLEFSQDILGLLYKMQCQAGGQCGASYLVIYNNDQFVDRLEIEHEYADAGFENRLNYKINGNKIELNLQISDYNDDDEGNIIIDKKTDSTFHYLVDLKSGRITKD